MKMPWDNLLQMLVVGFLQPFLYKYIKDVEDQARKKMPAFFPEEGGVVVPAGREVEFVAGIIKALLATIQKKGGAK